MLCTRSGASLAREWGDPADGWESCPPTALLSTVPVFTRTPSGPPSEVDVKMRHLGLSSRGLVAPAAGSQPPAVHIQSLMEMGLKGPAVKSNQVTLTGRLCSGFPPSLAEALLGLLGSWTLSSAQSCALLISTGVTL